MKIGYARVSTPDQSLDLQTDALKEAGCEKIFSDRGVSGAKTERPGLDKALDQIRKGDILVIWKLDRLGRSLSHLLSIIEDLKQKGVDFASSGWLRYFYCVGEDGFLCDWCDGRV